MQLTANKCSTNNRRRHVVMGKQLKQIHTKSIVKANLGVDLLSTQVIRDYLRFTPPIVYYLISVIDWCHGN